MIKNSKIFQHNEIIQVFRGQHFPPNTKDVHNVRMQINGLSITEMAFIKETRNGFEFVYAEMIHCYVHYMRWVNLVRYLSCLIIVPQ